MLKRQAAEGIEQQKRIMVAAIYANANYGKEDIEKAVGALEDHYKAAIEMVYPKPGAQRRKQGQEPDWNNPFWAGAARSYEKQREALAKLRGSNSTEAMTAGQVIEAEEKWTRRREMYDQTTPKK